MYKTMTAAVLALVAMPAFAAGKIVAPTSGTIVSGGPGFGTLTETFNQAGLSAGYTAGVTDFDTYLAGNPTHTITFSGFEWFGNSDTTSAEVIYDFGSVIGIDRLALWNEEASGIGRLLLSASVDGVTFSGLGTFSPTDNTVDYVADVFSFAATSARYVKFDMRECPQPLRSGGATPFPACAIGEVAFRTADVAGGIPEPATWAMMILGFGLVGAAARRRVARVAA